MKRIGFEQEKCENCGKCSDICPTGALTMKNGELEFEGKLCDHIFTCIDVCPTGALKVVEE